MSGHHPAPPKKCNSMDGGWIPSLMTHELGIDSGSHVRKKFKRQREEFAEDILANQHWLKISKCMLPGNPMSTFVMAFSPSGHIVASTHKNHMIYVTEIATRKCIHELRGHERSPWSLAFHPKMENMLASGCLAGSVRIWDLKSEECQVVTPGNGSTGVASLAFHPSDPLLLYAIGNHIVFWDWKSGTELVRLQTACERDKIKYVKLDPTGKHLITGIANSNSMFCRDRGTTGSQHLGVWVRQDLSGPMMGLIHRDAMTLAQEIGLEQARTFADLITRGYVAQQARQQGNEDDLRARRIALLLRNRALNTLRGLRAPFPLRRLPPLIDDVFPHQQIPQEGGAEEVIVEQPDSNPESVQVSDMLNELRTQVRILMDSIRNSVIDEEVMPVILSSLERSEAALGRAIQRYEVLMERLQRHQAARLSSALHLFRSLQAEFRHLVDSRDTSASGMRLARFHVSMTTRLIDLIIVLLQARSHLDVMQQSMQGNHDGENEDPIRVQFDGDRESHDGEEPEEITIEVPLPALRRPPLVRQNPVIADEVDDVDIARAPRDLPNLVPIGGIGGGGIVSHRIQMWDLSPGHPLPPIHLQEKNVVIKCCQLYNDASIDISSDGNMLVAISQDCGYPRLSVFRVHSLRLEDLGVCLHVFHTRVNAVSIGFSPLSRYIIIGLENRRPLFQIDDDNGPAVMALLLKLTTPEEGKTEKSMTLACKMRMSRTRSINVIRFLPTPGQGIIYGTNKGELNVFV